jgi:hypothetical protein
MLQIPARLEFLCRLSLSFLWLFTAVTSFWWGRQIGYDVLAQQHIQGELADWCIDAGSILDALIGIWLLTAYKLKWCYRFQIALIISYSILLTVIAPEFWLHPFGPLTKNIPLLALLVLLYKDNTDN